MFILYYRKDKEYQCQHQRIRPESDHADTPQPEKMVMQAQTRCGDEAARTMGEKCNRVTK